MKVIASSLRKGSVVDKMPGDFWQKMANLRLLIAYQYTRPGKQLMFMGTEFAQHNEWNHDASLDWHIADHPQRKGLQDFIAELSKLYKATPALWRGDPTGEGFEWLDVSDRENTVLTFLRKDGADYVIVVLNFTPVPRDNYRIGAPKAGKYRMILCSDDAEFGGSAYAVPREPATDPIGAHGRPNSVNVNLPPLAALVLLFVE